VNLAFTPAHHWLKKKVFSWSGSRSIHLPGSREMICESGFSSCESLASVTFDANSRLLRLEKEKFLVVDRVK
jgi:hypothetical protein